MTGDPALGADRDAADSWHSQLLQTLANVKLGWLLTGLVTLSAAAYSVSYALDEQGGGTYTFFGGLARLVADAALSSAVVGLAYEWLVRKETSHALQLMFSRSLRVHEESLVNAVVREIPTSLLLDKQLQRSVMFTPGKVDEIIRGALAAKLADDEMSNSIYDGLLQKTFSYTERYSDLRVEITLSNVADGEPEDVRVTFYDVVVTLRYRTRLNATRFIFARALDPDQFNLRIRHPDYIFTWRLEESAGLPKDSSRALTLHRFAIDDVELTRVPRVTADGAYEIVCEDPRLAGKLNQEVTVHYTVQTKLRRHDHVFFYTTVRPTKGVTVILNYARTDIEAVLAYDFFVAGANPVIYQVPPDRPHTVVVELDEWVFPKGGVAFVWRLAGEEGQAEAADELALSPDLAPDATAADD